MTHTTNNLAVVQTNDNWTRDHWISGLELKFSLKGKDSKNNEAWITPTLSDPALVLSQDDAGKVTVLWHDIVYIVQSIDLDFISPEKAQPTDREQSFIDADLMASAPEMLVALRTVADWFGDDEQSWDGWDGVTELIDQLQHAIANATRNEVN